jgi:integrase
MYARALAGLVGGLAFLPIIAVGCHTWRATGITIYLENDGRLEHAQQMAGHESPRTTKLYDRTKDEITLSEVERIRL